MTVEYLLMPKVSMKIYGRPMAIGVGPELENGEEPFLYHCWDESDIFHARGLGYTILRREGTDYVREHCDKCGAVAGEPNVYIYHWPVVVWEYSQEHRGMMPHHEEIEGLCTHCAPIT